MNKERYTAYKDLIEKKGKVDITALVRYTASNEFMTKMFLSELIKEDLIIQKDGYYYLGKEPEW